MYVFLLTFTNPDCLSDMGHGDHITEALAPGCPFCTFKAAKKAAEEDLTEHIAEANEMDETEIEIKFNWVRKYDVWTLDISKEFDIITVISKLEVRSE